MPHLFWIQHWQVRVEVKRESHLALVEEEDVVRDGGGSLSCFSMTGFSFFGTTAAPITVFGTPSISDALDDADRFRQSPSFMSAVRGAKSLANEDSRGGIRRRDQRS
jgi:hypothetical protein